MTNLKEVKNMKHMQKATEDFDRRWQLHHEAGGQPLTDAFRVMILLQIMPKKEEDEMRLRYVNQQMTYAMLKGHIDNWIEQMASMKRGDPMDVDSLQQAEEDKNPGARDPELEAKLNEALLALREAKKFKGGKGLKGKKGKAALAGKKGKTEDARP